VAASVFVFAGCIAAVNIAQVVTKGKSPFSRAYDVFVDHHMGAGSVSARAIVFVLSRACKGKVFYDVDEYLKSQNLSVITDAAKLSNHLVVIMGSETWCRSWCVGAITTSVMHKIPIQTVALPGSSAKVVNSFDGHQMNILAKQSPTDELRPLGLRDELIAQAIKLLVQITPIEFSMSTECPFGEFVVAMSGVLTKAPWAEPAPQMWKHSNELGAKNFILMSSDHSDPEAVCSSHLFHRIFEDLLEGTRAQPHIVRAQARANAAAGGVQKSTPASKLSEIEAATLQSLWFIEDCDLSATDFAALCRSGQCVATVVILTSGSLKSTVQLMRLGFQLKFSNEKTPFKPLAVPISDVFSSPGAQLLDDVEKGKWLNLGDDPRQAMMQSCAAEVSLNWVRVALQTMLETEYVLVDTAKANGVLLPKRLLKVLSQVAAIISKPAITVGAVRDEDFSMPKGSPSQCNEDGELSYVEIEV